MTDINKHQQVNYWLLTQDWFILNVLGLNKFGEINIPLTWDTGAMLQNQNKLCETINKIK